MKTSIHSHKGFTLIELLIAVAVFAILAIISVIALRQTIINQEIIERNIYEFREIQSAFQVIQRDLSQVTTRPVYTTLFNQTPAFVERKTDDAIIIEFTRAGFRNPNLMMNRSSLQRVAYIFRNNQLIRRSWSELDTNDSPNASEQILFNNISLVGWNFYDSSNKPHRLWPPVANLATTPPKAVQLDILIPEYGRISRIFELPQRIITVRN
jgi:general secretion pathway protein J